MKLWNWIIVCLVGIGDVILYVLKELKSIKVITMVLLLGLLYISIIEKFDSIALQIVLPIVFGFLFHLRSKEKNTLFSGDDNEQNKV